jgi:hypothetical protein
MYIRFYSINQYINPIVVDYYHFLWVLKEGWRLKAHTFGDFFRMKFTKSLGNLALIG